MSNEDTLLLKNVRQFLFIYDQWTEGGEGGSGSCQHWSANCTGYHFLLTDRQTDRQTDNSEVTFPKNIPILTVN